MWLRLTAVDTLGRAATPTPSVGLKVTRVSLFSEAGFHCAARLVLVWAVLGQPSEPRASRAVPTLPWLAAGHLAPCTPGGWECARVSLDLGCSLALRARPVETAAGCALLTASRSLSLLCSPGGEAHCVTWSQSPSYRHRTGSSRTEKQAQGTWGRFVSVRMSLSAPGGHGGEGRALRPPSGSRGRLAATSSRTSSWSCPHIRTGSSWEAGFRPQREGKCWLAVTGASGHALQLATASRPRFPPQTSASRARGSQSCSQLVSDEGQSERPLQARRLLQGRVLEL